MLSKHIMHTYTARSKHCLLLGVKVCNSDTIWNTEKQADNPVPSSISLLYMYISNFDLSIKYLTVSSFSRSI